MSDWSPTGAPFPISEAASACASLERSYRRLVACYPRSFQRENTEEIIAVLLATAREGLTKCLGVGVVGQISYVEARAHLDSLSNGTTR